MLLTDHQLAARRPVWGALASMFLATDVALTRDARSAVLAASPYSTAELENILISEIYPLCWGNLNSPAGEGIAFTPEWLEARIVPMLRRDAAGETYSRLLELARVAVPHSSEWQATKDAVAAWRRANPADTGTASR